MTTVESLQTQINSVISLYSNGQIQEALDRVEILTKDYPNEPLLYNISGACYKAIGRLDAALKSFEKTVALKPDYADAHYNLGIVFMDLNRLDAALNCYKKALTIKPDYAEAHNNLGATFKALQQLDGAIKSYERALAIKPDYAEAHNNLGVTLKELGQLDAAFKEFKKAVALKPDYAGAYANLGGVLLDLKRMDEALVSYERAITLDPNINFLFGILLHTKMHLCIWDDLASHLNELTSKVNNGEKVLNPFPLLAMIDDPKIQRKAAEIYVDSSYPQNHFLPKIERYPKHKKIRIGYFSADFHNHATMHLMAGLFESHDKNVFELIAFSFGPDKQDPWRQKVLLSFDKFVDVRLKSDRKISLLARKMEIDIAIDLKGYTQDCRPNIFAEGSAPIQVSYLGYPGTMAAEYIDYLIADHTLIPEESQKYYSEKIVYMPYSYQVNVSKRSVSETSLLRHELGLPETGFVFCCFNNNYKITPTTFTGWMRILKAVEDSVLWLYEKNNNTANNLKKEAIKFGINEDRLVFATFMPVEDHLNRIKQADLFIDTLPYNAHTTTSDALRMGLPVLTCIGNSFASRVAASLLNAVNLPELITSTQEQYESVAIELATDPEKLKIIKDKLADNLATAPLYDTPLFTRHLESAYLTMYDRYQQGLDPEHIYVEH